MNKINNITTEKKTAKRQFNGVVVSDVGEKTIHVLVKNRKTDSKYRKQFTTTKKYPVHDEKNQAKTGDEVCFEECRPYSKTKRWRLISIEKTN